MADQITALLGTSAAAVSEGGQTPEELAAQVLKGGKKRKVQWLLDQPLPVVRRTDEAHTAASEDQIAALFAAYADLDRIGRSGMAAAVAADLEEKDLQLLACDVWELWMKAGAQSKTKWVLSFAAVFGGAAMTPRLLRAINDWPQNARGAIACDAVTALSVSPDPAALVAVDSISRKFKFRQVKAAAAAALESAAQALGITAEELADRIVPTLDFAPDGTRVFDYGPRRFTVRLTPSLELTVTTETGKAVKSMPAPGKTDDPQKTAAAYEAFKALKKQMKTTVTAQRARLELALSAQRCWDAEAWRRLFVENPVMHQFAISLIWGVYEDGRLKETFRYMEDGSFNTVEEEEYELPAGASIGLVHPIELDGDTLEAWKQQLEDYEIVQSADAADSGRDLFPPVSSEPPAPRGVRHAQKHPIEKQTAKRLPLRLTAVSLAVSRRGSLLFRRRAAAPPAPERERRLAVFPKPQLRARTLHVNLPALHEAANPESHMSRTRRTAARQDRPPQSCTTGASGSALCSAARRSCRPR